MSAPQNNPLRPLTPLERDALAKISRALTLGADQVARAKELLAVAEGKSFQAAARRAGRKSGLAVAQLVARFNQTGLQALLTRHGGGPAVLYTEIERERVLQEFRRTPDRVQDGTATWSLSTLQRALRKAPDGLPKICTQTIGKVLHEAGYSWQKDRSWCDTGKVVRLRKSGPVEVTDPDTVPKKKLIEAAYTQKELPLYTEDEAGPFETIPQPGHSWQPQGEPLRYPHEYIRNGIAKMLTLFCPATGEVEVKGVLSTANKVLHPWLKEQLLEILAHLPAPLPLSMTENLALWEQWQAGLTGAPSLGTGEDLPPLRLLLILDNLAGHHTPSFISWLCEQGIMPLFTPLGGSWLNMAESIQHIIISRALAGTQPKKPQEIIAWLEETAEGWNKAPTAFEWGGKRKARRDRARQRRQSHTLAKSGACAEAPVPLHLAGENHPLAA
jgi:transposase